MTDFRKKNLRREGKNRKRDRRRKMRRNAVQNGRGCIVDSRRV